MTQRMRYRPMTWAAAVAVSGLLSTAIAAIAPMPCISQNVPAYASSVYGDGNSMATQAAKFSNVQWRSNGQPGWIAYDLSAVPVAKRSKILVAWYSSGGNYDASIIAGNTYDVPGPYVIEGNPAAGGTGGSPASGWVTVATGPNPQLYTCHHHIIDNFNDYNWLQFRTLAGNPNNATGNYDCSMKMDVYDLSGGNTDSWFIAGNSITAMTWSSNQFGVLVHAKSANYWPACQGGGVGYMTTADGLHTLLPKWLPDIPARYIILCYGTNDGESPATFYSYYDSLVTLILGANKVPVIGTIIWSRDATRDSNYVKYNQRLALLKAARPQIINGPDLYHTFEGHNAWYQDDLHPNPEGQDTLRNTWANWALANIYSGTVAAFPDGAKTPARPALVMPVFVSGRTISFIPPRSGTVKAFDIAGKLVCPVRVRAGEIARVTVLSPGLFFLKADSGMPWRSMVSP